MEKSILSYRYLQMALQVPNMAAAQGSETALAQRFDLCVADTLLKIGMCFFVLNYFYFKLTNMS